MMGGGLIRQSSYRKVIIDALAREGIVFKVEQTVDDVAGDGALGILERSLHQGRI